MTELVAATACAMGNWSKRLADGATAEIDVPATSRVERLPRDVIVMWKESRMRIGGVFEFDVAELGAPRDGKPSVLEG